MLANEETPGDVVESGNNTEQSPYKVYKSRWYVLVMFALLGISQNMTSTTMSPIAPIAEPALHLTQTDISLLANWFNVVFIITLIPYTMILQTRGLRFPIVSAAICTAIGAAIRCLHVTNGGTSVFDKITLHLGLIINGIPASVLWFGCTKVSVVWFPPSERIISTTIGLVAGPLGTALNFLIGPYTVKYLAKTLAPIDGEEPTLDNYALAIRYLCYGEAIYSGLVCVLTLLYFPSEPPTPPSYTAKSERFQFLPGVIGFATNLDAWLLLTLSSVSSAFLNGWTQFLALTMHNVMDEVQAGWIGFVMLLAPLVSGPIASFSSRWWLHCHQKIVPAAILSVGAGATILLFIAAIFVPSIMSPTLCWCSLTIAALFIQSCQPIYWEMACEAVYPVPEPISAGMFALGNTVISIIFYVLYSVPSLGTAWTFWCLAISECLCVPIIFFYSGKARRLAEDQRAIVSSNKNSRFYAASEAP